MKRATFIKYVVFSLFVMAGFRGYAQTEMSTLVELVYYSKQDSVNVKMKAGTYNITPAEAGSGKLLSNSTLFSFEGNGSTYDFEGAEFIISTDVFNQFGNVQVIEMAFVGNNNVIKNLTMTDSLSSPTDRPSKTALAVQIDGQGNLLENANLTIRGSYPYGYGDIFGKGGTNTVVKHYKHSAILVRGESNHVLNCKVFHRAYGHCIFMQGASNPTIEGCTIEGEMRTTDDMLAEEGTGTIADQKDFMTTWGYRLLPGYMLSCQEEGIRAYNGGKTIIDGVEYERGTINPTVINNTVKHFRGGVTLAHATGTVKVSGNTTIGCEGGYSVPSNGTVANCTADVSYGTALSFAYETAKNVTADITINQLFDAYNAAKSIAYIGGSNHNITLKLEEGAEIDSSLVIKISGLKNSLRTQNGVNPSQNDHTSNNVNIKNYTNTTIVLAPKSSNCTGESYVAVLDSGTNNNINIVTVDVDDIEASDNEIVCYPNPAINMVKLSSSNIIKEVIVMTMVGREVFRTQVKSDNECMINVNELSAAPYLFQVIDEKGNKNTVRVLVK